MCQMLIVESDYATHDIDRGVPLKDLDDTSFKTDIAPFTLVQMLDFFIVTDKNERKFRFMKSREPEFSREKLYDIDDLTEILANLRQKGW